MVHAYVMVYIINNHMLVNVLIHVHQFLLNIMVIMLLDIVQQVVQIIHLHLTML